MSRSDRVIGILLGIVVGIVVLILFVVLGSEDAIDSPSIDHSQSPGATTQATDR